LGADITVEWFSGSATPIIDELFSGPSADNTKQEFTIPGMDHNHYATCIMAQELKAQLTTGMTVADAMDANPAEIKRNA
jgi:hypothetical protein